MNEIAQALAAYSSSLAVVERLRESGEFRSELRPAASTFQSTLYYQPTLTLRAFVAVMELVDADRLAQLAPKTRLTRDQKEHHYRAAEAEKKALVARALELLARNT